MRKFKVVIFDMDGVLIDDFEPWMKFDVEFLSQFGSRPDQEYITFVNGRSEEEVMEWVIEKHGLDLTVEELKESRKEKVREIYQEHAKPMKGVENLMNNIRKKGVRQALASGAKTWMVDIVVNRFSWYDFFEEIVCSDHVDYKGKPNPEIYLHTARLLRVDPSECVVIEDAENGIEAAKQAGMQCIALEEPRLGVENLDKADLVVDSLEDKKIYRYLGI